MRQLALDHLRHRALVQHEEHVARFFRQRAAVDVDELCAGEPRGRDLDPIFVDGRARGLHLLDKSQQWAAESNDVGNPTSRQCGRTHREK